VPDLYLQFAGAIVEPALETKMRGLIAQKALSENVEFLGHLSEAQLLEVYEQTSILLLTSEIETSPMAVTQAMAAGKAVVAKAVGGVPFLIDDGRTGLLVEPNNPQQIADAIVRLAQDHDLRQRVGQAARQEALERFEAKAVAEKTYMVYQSILKEAI
jgi:glycosyltransferase involved in cell wall biosynthesis